MNKIGEMSSSQLSWKQAQKNLKNSQNGNSGKGKLNKAET
jgi:hypothetical protein